MSEILLNSNGVNLKIKANILSEEEMREIGFNDNSKDKWFFFRNVLREKAEGGQSYGSQYFEVTFNVTIPKDGSDISIDVLDEDFCQPYDYQYILSKNPENKTALKVQENVEKWMEYLKDKGILEGHEYGEYI